jgi:hypothetical protein
VEDVDDAVWPFPQQFFGFRTSWYDSSHESRMNGMGT